MRINSVKLESVQKVKQISNLSLSELKSLKRGLNQTLLEMSLEWDDSKKKEFEEIVYSIKDSLNIPIKELERINPLLQEIIQIIEEYEVSESLLDSVRQAIYFAANSLQMQKEQE